MQHVADLTVYDAHYTLLRRNGLDCNGIPKDPETCCLGFAVASSAMSWKQAERSVEGRKGINTLAELCDRPSSLRLGHQPLSVFNQALGKLVQALG